MTSANYNQNDGLNPLPLPTGIINKLIPLSSPSTDVSTTQAASPEAAASTPSPSPSPRPSASGQAPASNRQAQYVTAGDPIDKAGPPGAEQPDPRVAEPRADTTSTVNVTVTPGWTPTKVMLAGSLTAVIVLAVLAMLLLSRRGRPSVSRNSGTVLIGNDEEADRHHLRPRPRPTARAVVHVPELTATRVGAILDDDSTGPMGIDPETIHAARRLAWRLNDRRP